MWACHFPPAPPILHMQLFKTTLQTHFDYRFHSYQRFFKNSLPPPTPSPPVFQTGTALTDNSENQVEQGSNVSIIQFDKNYTFNNQFERKIL